MKQTWDITISGACKTFTGLELIERFYGDHDQAVARRDKLETDHGRIMYLSLTIPQPDRSNG